MRGLRWWLLLTCGFRPGSSWKYWLIPGVFTSVWPVYLLLVQSIFLLLTYSICSIFLSLQTNQSCKLAQSLCSAKSATTKQKSSSENIFQMLHFLIKLLYELSDIHLQDLCTCEGKSEHLDCDTAWNEEVEILDITCTNMCLSIYSIWGSSQKKQQHKTPKRVSLSAFIFVMCTQMFPRMNTVRHRHELHTDFTVSTDVFNTSSTTRSKRRFTSRSSFTSFLRYPESLLDVHSTLKWIQTLFKSTIST